MRVKKNLVQCFKCCNKFYFCRYEVLGRSFRIVVKKVIICITHSKKKFLSFVQA